MLFSARHLTQQHGNSMHTQQLDVDCQPSSEDFAEELWQLACTVCIEAPIVLRCVPS